MPSTITLRSFSTARRASSQAASSRSWLLLDQPGFCRLAHRLTFSLKTGQIPVNEPIETQGDPALLADIFVSYSSDDRARVEPLISRLEAVGYSVWWDHRLHGGSMFSEEIETELENAAFVVVAWSASSIKSRWVADEADAALQAGKLIPVRFDDVKPPLGFRQVQTIDFSDWNRNAGDAAFRTLTVALSHLRDGPAVSPGSTPSQQAPPARTPFASIAVLPFVNMSPDPDQEYFSDGISEELLNLLARVKEMRVIARTSSFALKGSDKQVTEIGEMLGVAYVLEGSVRKASDKVRITAQLIETGTGFHVWSEI